jgi:hypothetical protein
MQPSQVNCYLGVEAFRIDQKLGRGEDNPGSGTGKNYRIALGYEKLRVKNAGCNEDFAVESAKF